MKNISNRNISKFKKTEEVIELLIEGEYSDKLDVLAFVYNTNPKSILEALIEISYDNFINEE
jgi:hypothetical protein